MSLDFDTQKIVIIVGAVVGIIIILVIPYLIIRHVRRSEKAANIEANNQRLFREQVEQRGRNLGDLEYGLDTRAEAQPSSYHGGMADVTHFARNRAIYCPPQSQVAVLGKTSTNRVAPPLGRRSSQPNLGSSSSRAISSPQRLNTNVAARTSLDDRRPGNDSPVEITRAEEDVPPAYSAVVPHR